MKRTHNLKVANGKYTKDGDEKTRWLTIGALLQGDGKMKLKLDTIPISEFDGWVQCFPVEDRPQQAGDQGFNDDVPF
jgi:hypothetical protein